MENKMKHTPGPWILCQPASVTMPRNGSVIYGFSDVDGWAVIAECVPNTREDGSQIFDRKANAALIAAAPELLEALKAIRAEYGDCTKPTMICAQRMFNIARAAIAKAEGKS